MQEWFSILACYLIFLYVLATFGQVGSKINVYDAKQFTFAANFRTVKMSAAHLHKGAKKAAG